MSFTRVFLWRGVNIGFFLGFRPLRPATSSRLWVEETKIFTPRSFCTSAFIHLSQQSLFVYILLHTTSSLQANSWLGSHDVFLNVLSTKWFVELEHSISIPYYSISASTFFSNVVQRLPAHAHTVLDIIMNLRLSSSFERQFMRSCIVCINPGLFFCLFTTICTKQLTKTTTASGFSLWTNQDSPIGRKHGRLLQS